MYFGIRLYAGIPHIAHFLAVWNRSVPLEIPIRPPTVRCCHSIAISIDLSLTKLSQTTTVHPPSCCHLPICADVTSRRGIYFLKARLYGFPRNLIYNMINSVDDSNTTPDVLMDISFHKTIDIHSELVLSCILLQDAGTCSDFLQLSHKKTISDVE